MYICLPYRRSSPTYLSFSLFYTILLALHHTLLFLLSILHNTSFSSPSYTTLPSPLDHTLQTLPFLCPTLLFLLLSILDYPCFSRSYTANPLLLCPTLPFLRLNLPFLFIFILHVFLLSILHYSSFSLSYRLQFPTFSSLYYTTQEGTIY